MMLVTDTIAIQELENMSQHMFLKLVKAVVDIEENIMVVDGELHADQELLLLDRGSDQKNLWGINLHPEHFGTENFIEFDSMINLRPSWGNKTRSVDNPEVRQRIIALVHTKVIS